jgi:hypothetical protein
MDAQLEAVSMPSLNCLDEQESGDAEALPVVLDRAAAEPDTELEQTAGCSRTDHAMGADMARACDKARERYREYGAPRVGDRAARETTTRVCHANALASYWAEEDEYAAERSEVLILPGLLSHTEVDTVHQAGADAQAKELHASSGGGSCSFMATIPPHLRPVYQAHLKSFLHRDNDFSISHASLSAKLIHAMQSQPGDWGPDAHGIDLNIRCIEYHTYTRGGGLVAPGHCDNGSVLTLSVMLSDPHDVGGGHFVTFTDGEPVAHKLSRGDAILFRSEKHHNVTTVQTGVRQSLVLELWVQPQNTHDRFS